MIPAFWFEQTVELDEDLAREALVSSNWVCLWVKYLKFTLFFISQMALELPSIGIYVAYGVMGLGSILVIVGLIATLTRRWNSYENLDDELTS